VSSPPLEPLELVPLEPEELVPLDPEELVPLEPEELVVSSPLEPDDDLPESFFLVPPSLVPSPSSMSATVVLAAQATRTAATESTETAMAACFI
jgi:hypothetical protein